MSILRALPSEGAWVFPGTRRGQPIGPLAMWNVLKDTGHAELTVHGFRSTFRDWAAEATAYPNHVCEQALAHAIAGAVEAAYRRGDLFEKRQRLMEDWAAYCISPPTRTGEVTPIRNRRHG